ncbi:NAD(P)/FAD-dependent oxidoreductase [Cohaesibacter haloalkalitolerans]|uniref:NAD(P)/FAD-dependent oxidoreductase n=1 Tax=Cohaesibacter haloalkalitolerans TaxID=1162980 RepID=UPI000E65E62F|nr:FAD/NAD(P)-binding oxidoreductase [Cohaesibacter haloalkalitolerans]
MSKTKSVVVVGAGQAGATLVQRLRELGYDGALTLIGAEPYLPYQRPPLSKAYLLGSMDLEGLTLRPQSFYDDQNIQLLLGKPVTAIDRDNQTVTLGDEIIAYDHLVLATGGDAASLPAEQGGALEGLYSIRGIADINRLEPQIIAGRKVLIVGGGYIGLEAAAVCAKRGLDVTLVVASERVLRRVAAPETSDYFRALHKGHGVRVIEGAGSVALIGDTEEGRSGQVCGATLGNGLSLEADFVIIGIGLTPSVTLAEMAGLTLDNGIWTDEHGRTSDAHVWAAGDCTSFPYRGGRIRLESVGNAIDQAKAVATNIVASLNGEELTPYIAKPWFWSDQYDVKFQIAGLNTGYDHVVIRDGGDGAVSHWYYRGDELLAVDAMNDGRAYMVGKRLIEAGKSADPAIITDPSVDLKVLMKRG